MHLDSENVDLQHLDLENVDTQLSGDPNFPNASTSRMENIILRSLEDPDVFGLKIREAISAWVLECCD